MTNRFTGRALKVLEFAQYEAQELEQNFIGTEHILLGLLHEGEGIAARALRSLGLDLVMCARASKICSADARWRSGAHRITRIAPSA